MADNNSNELDALMISELPTQATANETDLFEVAIVDANSASGYASKKESAAAIADAIVGEYQYPLRITGTTAKTIAGAINELKNLVDLLPQFAIEVVNTLPVSDISTTTIYLVPASDPEQGNYYEEYIYVNNAWELVGTTAVDLSGYYTSAQVDTLLAAKADSSSLATVATSGAYSDLTGKPTIDTALDTTSTNAVENRAIASEINSIKSDITVEGSASGDIATFVDGSDNPLKELEISIEAVQSGSGDPSPTNVRPITGWTGCNVARAGSNLAKFTDGYGINANGEVVTQTGRFATINPIPINPNITYYIQAGISGLSFIIAIFNGSTLVRRTAGISSGSLLDTSGGTKMYVCGYRATDVTVTDCNPMVKATSDTLNYESYNGNIYNINWQSVAGTVYGGTLDVKRGVLTVTHVCNRITTISSVTGEGKGAIIDLSPLASSNILSDNDLKCNCLRPSNYSAVYDNHVHFSNQLKCVLCFADLIATTKVEWEEYLDENPIYICYKIATPITYQLTPTEIRSLLGVNNVWADCGSITELKYTRDLNLCINDIIARIEALEGASNTRSLSLSPTLTKSLTSELDTAEGKTEETEEETKEEAQNER